MLQRFSTCCASLLVLCGSLVAGEPAQAPKFVQIEVHPAKLHLKSERNVRSLLVTGVTTDGRRLDLTDKAVFNSAGAQVTVDKTGLVSPAKTGSTAVTVSAAGLTAKVSVVVDEFHPHPVSFIREVGPLLSKVGCNAGTCHGSQKGKAGFKLSLRGYDPLFDYRALVDDASGRRFNRSRPDQSLMLLKPTQAVPHEGGFLFDEDSRAYKLVHRWIAEGCKFEKHTRPNPLEVYPPAPLLPGTDDRQQLIVLAHYADGTIREVTRDAVYETSNFEVVTVSKTGKVQAVRRGEAAALVRFEGVYAAAPVTVVGERPGFEFKPSPEHNYVDKFVNAKLRRLKINPSATCSDAEFLRRVSIDLVGLPPTIEQTKAFLADKRPAPVKRQAKIEELLSSPGFVDHWTLKWSDLLLANRKFIKEKGVWAFRNWIRNSIATNKPYDKFVYELLTASGSTFENPAANYYRIAREPREVMENMTQVFLGTRFQCNQCHDHPFERWTQQQYYELSAYFSAVGRKPGVVKDDEIIYSLRSSPQIKHPGTGETIPAAFPFEHAGNVNKQSDPRVHLAQWLTSPQNPYFAKSLVNRYFSYFMGRGIIDPVDDIRASNPPSNPELLAALTDEFLKSGFDLKQSIRTIVSSHAYQRSYRTNKFNVFDDVNYSHALPRRLTAEQLYDAIMIATGAPNQIPGMPAGFRATQLPDPKVNLSFLDMFGRPPRESPCECERSSEVSLRQTLNLINGPTISDAIIHPQGLIARLTKARASRDKLIEEVYLSTLSRPPGDAERKNAQEYFAQVKNDGEATQDLMWALINSPAFLFNR